MGTVKIDLSVLCICGKPENAPEHHYGGHQYKPVRAADQIRDDQDAYPARRRGHSTIAEYRSLQSKKPPAGQDISMVVPATSRWKLKCLSALLTTDAVVANRVFNLVIQDPNNNIVFYAVSPVNQVAGTVIGYSAASGLTAYAFGTVIVVPLPLDTVLLPGWSIATVTVGLDAGDQWAPMNLLVKEHLQF